MRLLDDGLLQLGIKTTSFQRQQFVDFLSLLQKWKKTYNLTAIDSIDEMVVLHLFDSAAVAPHLQGEKILDVGTGAGLPGIPLAILFPEKQFYLLDSNQKKITFIQQVKLTLNINNIHPIKRRVEDYHPAQDFDCIISRAFASIDKFSSCCEHLASENSRLIAMKGKISTHEIQSCGGDIINLEIPFLDQERCLVIL